MPAQLPNGSPNGPRDYKTFSELSQASKRDRLTQINRIKRYWPEGEVSDYIPEECWPAIVKIEGKSFKAKTSHEAVAIVLSEAKEWPSNLLRRLVDVAAMTESDPVEAGEYLQKAIEDRRGASKDGETEIGITGSDCGKACISITTDREKKGIDEAKATGCVDPVQVTTRGRQKRIKTEEDSSMAGVVDTPMVTPQPQMATRKSRKHAASPSSRRQHGRRQHRSTMATGEMVVGQRYVDSATQTLSQQQQQQQQQQSERPRLPSLCNLFPDQQLVGQGHGHPPRSYMTTMMDIHSMVLDHTPPPPPHLSHRVMDVDAQLEHVQGRLKILATKERLLKLQRQHLIRQAY